MCIRDSLYERTHQGEKGYILTTPVEHHAILHTCRELEEMGCKISYLPVDESGRVIVGEAETYMSEHTALVSVMYANNEIGTIEPVKELGYIAGKRHLLFHTCLLYKSRCV